MLVLLDNIDLQIVTILQESGRITNSKLASRINLSTAATLERVRKLVQKNIITGYTAIISNRKLGLNYDYMVRIKLKSLTGSNIKNITKTIHSIPEITTCYHVTGDNTDILIRAIVDSDKSYNEKVLYPLYETGLISDIAQLAIIENVKNSGILLTNLKKNNSIG